MRYVVSPHFKGSVIECGQFDRDLDGQLDEKELRRLLRKLGREASRSEIREIMAQADLNAVRPRPEPSRSSITGQAS